MTSNGDGPSNSHAGPTTEFKSFTSEDRIRELVEIDQDVPKLLSSAGHAIKAMAPLTASEMRGFDTKAKKDEFEKHTSDFLNTLQAVTARLRRQVYALEEADIIPAQDPSSIPRTAEEESRLIAEQGVDERGNSIARSMAIENGGLGQLDVGYLNSRLDEVGKRKEGELWRDARVYLEKLTRGVDGSQSTNNDHDMSDALQSPKDEI